MLRITYVGHATVLIEMDGTRVMTDPILRRNTGPLRRVGTPVDPAVYADVDAVLLSHLHADHLHLGSLRLLGADTPLVVPDGCAAWLRAKGFAHATEVSAGDETAVGALRVVATPASHDGARRPFGGPRATPVGFLLEGSRTVYFAGDTDLFTEMKDIAEHVDVALLPIWGWGPTLGPGHMDPPSAARALTLLRPRIAIPIHWGTLVPAHMTWRPPTYLTSPPLRFAEAAALDAPDVEVAVLRPGATLDVD